jgi:cAMP-dependent protein kinase regulator
MSLPVSYQNEIKALEREILAQKPKDILQFCANFFNRRLESQRTEFILAQGHLGRDGQKMAASAFPGTNPFGQNMGFSSNRGVQSIEEEEEEENDHAGSPTDATFKTSRFGQSGHGTSPFTNSSPFGLAAGTGGGAMFSAPFGGGDANGNIPDESASGPPSSFPGSTAGSVDSLPANYATGRRVSVSAESMNPNADSGDWKPPSYPKTAEQIQRLKTAVSNNFLFSSLDDDSFQTILNALQEKVIPTANIKVISQGDSGDFFYVVEKGDFDVYIHPSGSVQPGPDGMGKKVTTIGPGGGFGELALMYDAPRAATVVSTSPKGGLLWQLDRTTFRRILMDSAFQRRKMYEGFLEEVPLLSSLKAPERAKIADALSPQKYPAGTYIIREGEAGDAFYLLESGEAEAYKAGVEKPVKHYERGAYFGELALLDDKPRQASVVAKTEVKLARLDRAGFKRLLGPVEGMMRREQYVSADEVDPLSRLDTLGHGSGRGKEAERGGG